VDPTVYLATCPSLHLQARCNSVAQVHPGVGNSSLLTIRLENVSVDRAFILSRHNMLVRVTRRLKVIPSWITKQKVLRQPLFLWGGT
jgi:hypothetical protein